MRDDCLTITEAAEILRLARASVRMLCKAGRLKVLDAAEGGATQILRVSVEEFMAAHPEPASSEVRQAGLDAGVYQYDDHYYSSCWRR